MWDGIVQISLHLKHNKTSTPSFDRCEKGYSTLTLYVTVSMPHDRLLVRFMSWSSEPSFYVCVFYRESKKISYSTGKASHGYLMIRHDQVFVKEQTRICRAREPLASSLKLKTSSLDFARSEAGLMGWAKW